VGDRPAKKGGRFGLERGKKVTFWAFCGRSNGHLIPICMTVKSVSPSKEKRLRVEKGGQKGANSSEKGSQLSGGSVGGLPSEELGRTSSLIPTFQKKKRRQWNYKARFA